MTLAGFGILLSRSAERCRVAASWTGAREDEEEECL